MDNEEVLLWLKENFETSTVKVGSQLILSLAVLSEETRPAIFNFKGKNINPENLLEILLRLENMGWKEVNLNQNLSVFISDINEILSSLSQKHRSKI